jgi:peptidoglycan hydrolase-like protein with peptidoglycan-binding domain
MIKTRSMAAALALAGFVGLAGCASGDNQATTQSRNVTPLAPDTATAAVATNPDVSPGTLKRIQITLRDERFYNGRIDGLWGPQTQSGIRGYQHAHNLVDNGKLDSATLNSLKVASSSAPTPPAETSHAVVAPVAVTHDAPAPPAETSHAVVAPVAPTYSAPTPLAASSGAVVAPVAPATN